MAVAVGCAVTSVPTTGRCGGRAGGRPRLLSGDDDRWAKKNKVELCFTSTYASWANPIEAHFGPLRQFTLANSHHRSHPAQTQALHRYLRWRNTNARHRDILAAQRKERAHIHSEKGIRWGGRPLPAAA